ncbi:ABC transporter permease subunit [Promineifilum sp.]|uniref:ABC transporter permease subunit n=1 Tax=Promineifilum sp. TaxID=2664178 RepID=UPI0035B0F41A
MPIFIIARLTIREAQRRRLLWVALFMGVAFLLVFGIAFHYIQLDLERQPTMEDQTSFVSVFLLTAGLYAVNLLVNVVAVLVSVTTLSGEIESHTIDAIVTKPIPRWQVVVGKWLGFAALVLAYLALLVSGLMLIVYLRSGFYMDNIGQGVLLMALAALLVLTVSIAGGTRLSTIANGVLTFMLFGLAFLGGLLEQVGALIRNQAAVNVGIVSSLIMPADALWKKAVAYFQPSGNSNPFELGPFAAITEPSSLMVVYALLYLTGLILFALWSFSRRDL